MEKKTFVLGTKKCIAYLKGEPEVLLIQPASGDEEGFLDAQVKAIEEGTDKGFMLVSFHIDDWNRELSPWQAPAVFGDEGFGNGAEETLRLISEKLIPSVKEKYDLNADIPICLGGYSLAGLFSLWCMYDTDVFSCVCGVSPSVWFEGWDEFISSHDPKVSAVYLSLGKKEEKTKNKTMARVGDRIKEQYDQLTRLGKKCILEWNEGGHFNDPGGRCAKGFIWCINNED